MTRIMITTLMLVTVLLVGCDGGSTSSSDKTTVATSSSQQCRQLLNDLISIEMNKPNYKSFTKHTFTKASIYYNNGRESTIECVGKYLQSDL